MSAVSLRPKVRIRFFGSAAPVSGAVFDGSIESGSKHMQNVTLENGFRSTDCYFVTILLSQVIVVAVVIIRAAGAQSI